jgi:inward rectifier potassium channel
MSRKNTNHQSSIEAPKAIQSIKVETIGQTQDTLDDLYHYILKASWARFIGLVSLFYIIANLLFAVLYYLFPSSIANMHEGSLIEAFSFSVQTMATIGYGAMAPTTPLGHFLVLIEALIGMFTTAVVTGITFAKFARPTARILFCKNAVICPRDGVPHLMFRMANWRHNQVSEVQVRVVLLVTEKTREGESLRRQIELPLAQNRSVFFVLTFNVMHQINEQSPFFGPNAMHNLKEKSAQIWLSMTGYDETLAQNISARQLYELSDIVQEHRFADVMTVLPNGARQIDYNKFNELIPIWKTKS